MLLLVHAWALAVALYSRFRSVPPALAREFATFVAMQGGAAQLANAAVKHHVVVSAFCKQRVAGCTWAEHHALVDLSREPWAHLFDALQIAARDLPPRPTLKTSSARQIGI